MRIKYTIRGWSGLEGDYEKTAISKVLSTTDKGFVVYDYEEDMFVFVGFQNAKLVPSVFSRFKKTINQKKTNFTEETIAYIKAKQQRQKDEAPPQFKVDRWIKAVGFVKINDFLYVLPGSLRRILNIKINTNDDGDPASVNITLLSEEEHDLDDFKIIVNNASVKFQESDIISFLNLLLQGEINRKLVYLLGR